MHGTSGRTRTATPVKATDFESVVSTNFTTLASKERAIISAFLNRSIAIGR